MKINCPHDDQTIFKDLNVEILKRVRIKSNVKILLAMINLKRARFTKPGSDVTCKYKWQKHL